MNSTFYEFIILIVKLSFDKKRIFVYGDGDYLIEIRRV